MPRSILWLVVGTLLVLALAACGSRSSRVRQVTVGKYGSYGAETIVAPSGAAGDSRLCSADARGFATEAHSFVMRYGSTAASSTDVYYMGLREELADFAAHNCRKGTLGRALVQQLTAKQRGLLPNELTQAMAKQVQEALTAAR